MDQLYNIIQQQQQPSNESLRLKTQNVVWDFPGDPVVKNLPASTGDTGSIPGPGRFHVLQGN